MRPIIADPKKVIYIGQRGENIATQVIFPKSYFDGFTGTTYRLLAQRKTDAQPYPVVITEDSDNVYWTVSDTDCGVEGTGFCELQLAGANDLLVKSIKYVTQTGSALDTEGPMPAPYEDFANTIYNYAETAQEAAGDADQSARDAAASAQTAHDEVERFNVTVDGDSMFITVSGEGDR